MIGTVKYFNRDRGYGFIAVSGEPDRFFHISQIQNGESPTVGDTVLFEPDNGRDGRPIASNVTVSYHRPAKSERPYYGKATYRTEIVEPEKSENSKVGTSLGLGAIGLMTGGPIGGIVGAVLGAIFGENSKATPAITREVEITSPCIRCGGHGQVTNSVDGWTGFQCKTCRNYWRKRDEDLE